VCIARSEEDLEAFYQEMLPANEDSGA
jgi:hypothetical protein